MIQTKTPHLQTITVRFLADSVAAAARNANAYASFQNLHSLERFNVELELDEDGLHLIQEMQNLDLILIQFVPLTPRLRSVVVSIPEANRNMIERLGEECLSQTRRANPGVLRIASL